MDICLSVLMGFRPKIGGGGAIPRCLAMVVIDLLSIDFTRSELVSDLAFQWDGWILVIDSVHQ